MDDGKKSKPANRIRTNMKANYTDKKIAQWCKIDLMAE